MCVASTRTYTPTHSHIQAYWRKHVDFGQHKYKHKDNTHAHTKIYKQKKTNTSTTAKQHARATYIHRHVSHIYIALPTVLVHVLCNDLQVIHHINTQREIYLPQPKQKPKEISAKQQ